MLTHVGRHFVIWGHWRGAHHCQNGNAQITLLGLLVGGAAVATRSLAWWALAPARSASSIGAGLVVVCLGKPKPVPRDRLGNCVAPASGDGVLLGH